MQQQIEERRHADRERHLHAGGSRPRKIDQDDEATQAGGHAGGAADVAHDAQPERDEQPGGAQASPTAGSTSASRATVGASARRVGTRHQPQSPGEQREKTSDSEVKTRRDRPAARAEALLHISTRWNAPPISATAAGRGTSAPTSR